MVTDAGRKVECCKERIENKEQIIEKQNEIRQTQEKKKYL